MWAKWRLHCIATAGAWLQYVNNWSKDLTNKLFATVLTIKVGTKCDS